MSTYFLNKEQYELDLKFQHYQKKFLEAYSTEHDHEKAKQKVFKNWPEYGYLFGPIQFNIYD